MSQGFEKPPLPRPVPAPVQAKIRHGQALFQARRFAEAQRLAEEALASAPDNFDAHYLLGVIALQTGRIQQAAMLIAEAIGLNPNVAFAHFDLGCALDALTRHEEALASYDMATALKPDFLGAHFNRGNELTQLRRHDEALASYDRVIALNPGLMAAHFNRGNALTQLRRHDEALASYDRVIALDPGCAEAYANRSIALNALRRHEDALTSCDKAIALKPEFAEAYNSRGIALNALKRHNEALASCDKVIALNPHYAEAHTNRGNALMAMKRFDEALASYDTAIALNPDDAFTRENRGVLQLLLGRFEKGLPDYEFRKKTPNLQKFLTYPQPLWLGHEPIAGKTLLIHQELFLGDVLHFCRYAKLAEAHGAKVILLVQKSLHLLLKHLGPTITLLSDPDELPTFDYHCPLLSLPLAFKTTLECIPANAPYLGAEKDRVDKWRAELGDDGFKIGICWQGSTLAYAVPLERSCALRDFLDISKIAGVRLISLQKNAGVEQLLDLPAGMKVETLGDAFDAGPDAFLDTAAVMESLDLVITVDTSIAHLAGALARPTWVVLKYVPEWRWLLDRSGNPWYPTMRVFRQQRTGDWKSAFAQIETELRSRR